MKALQNPQTSHNLRHVTLNLYTSRSIIQWSLSLLIANSIIDKWAVREMFGLDFLAIPHSENGY